MAPAEVDQKVELERFACGAAAQCPVERAALNDVTVVVDHVGIVGPVEPRPGCHWRRSRPFAGTCAASEPVRPARVVDAVGPAHGADVESVRRWVDVRRPERLHHVHSRRRGRTCFRVLEIENQYAASGTGMRARTSQSMSLPSRLPPFASFHLATTLPQPASRAETLTVVCAVESGRTCARIHPPSIRASGARGPPPAGSGSRFARSARRSRLRSWSRWRSC